MSDPQHVDTPAQLDHQRWKALALLCTAFFVVGNDERPVG
jgi:hypothetical protein